MSIDRRLRQGLERSATVVDPDLRATLPDALNRGRRSKRWLNAARATTFIVSVTLVAVVGSQLLGGIRGERPATRTPTPSVSPQYEAIAGTYTATIEPHTGLPAGGMVGSWSLELSSDGVLAMAAPPGSTFPISAAFFQLHGYRFQTNAFSSNTCNGTIGTYEWGLSGGYLRFTKITDRCPVREAIFAARQWSKLTPASTASSAPPVTPVVPDDGSALLPGAYATAFQPRLRLSVTRGWTGNADTSDWFRIQLGHSDAAGALEFFHVHAVIDPRTQRTIPLPQNLVGWFTSHPAVRVVSPPRPTTIGGVEGTMFDVRLAPGWSCGYPGCVAFAPLGIPGEPGFGWASDAAPHLRSRMVVLRVQDAAVIVTFTSAGSRFRAGLRAADNVLSTVGFG
jgi:hypothetical protein